MPAKPMPWPADWETYGILDKGNADILATHYLGWAVNAPDGEQKLGDRAHFVTGGHNRASINPKTLKLNWSSGNSSCGDLPHSLLWVAGHRGKYVNRESEPGYRNGHNLIKIESHPAFEHGFITRQLSPGDTIYVGDRGNANSLHVVVVIEHEPDIDRLVVAQYGGTIGVGIDGRYSEYPSEKGLPFNGVRLGHLKNGQKYWKRVIGHLPFWAALEWAKENKCLDSLVFVPPGLEP